MPGILFKHSQNTTAFPNNPNNNKHLKNIHEMAEERRGDEKEERGDGEQESQADDPVMKQGK